MNERRQRLTRRALLLSLSVALAACGPGGSPNPNPNPNPNPGKTWEAPDGLEFAPGQKGTVKTIQVNGKPLTYEVIGGVAIYQGDMILGPESDLLAAALGGKLSAQAVICDWDNIATGWGLTCGRWPDNTVPYSIKNDWASDAENAMMRSRIRAAIAHWEANTALRFVERSSGRRIQFRNSEGCSSQVGRQGPFRSDPQDINLNTGCGFGATVHEIGHAIGLYHEQSREDRGGFVTINRDNIEDGKGHNFDRHADDGNDVGPYNYNSIMHYGCTAFSKNGLNTLQPSQPGVTCADLGNRSGLTDGDILAAYHMYPVGLTITAPAAGASIARNTSINAQLRADDPVKNDYLKWYLDSSTTPVGTGSSTTINPIGQRLSVGTHTLKARMEISGVVLQEKTVRFTLTNVNPSVSISQPTAGAQFCTGENVIFRALAADVDGTVAEGGIVWREGGTTLGTGSQRAIRFTTAGNHTVNVTATDNDGGVASASVTIRTVACSNNAPSVGITNPPDAPGSGPDLDVFPPTHDANGYYLDITLTGTASDVEDGAIPDAQMVWTTNRADLQPGGPSSGPQVLGTGRSLPVKLYSSCSSTDHVVTLTATDSAGNRRSMSRLIRVQTLC